MSNYQDIVLPPGVAGARPAAGSEGRLYYSTDTPILERDNGAGWDQYAPAGGGGGLYESYCCIVDQKAQNTSGGGFTQGAWRTRDINTEQADPDGIVAIAANQFILDAGTYRCIISAPAYQVDRHQLRLYNTTGAATLIVGTCAFMAAAVAAQTRSFVVGRFTVAGAQTLEVQHQCKTTRAVFGFGVESNFTDEIYAIAEFWKES